MRTQMSLNGLWKFFPAFDEISADQRWMAPDFDPARPDLTPKQENMGWMADTFDDAGWLDIPVPDSWNNAIEDLWSYEGSGWYRRSLDVPKEWDGRRVEFCSEGANYRTVVYVNGELAGEHEGGYTPFAIPVHSLLRYGERNTIAVSCDNLPKPERCPGGMFDWWNHGGLYRNVSLCTTGAAYIDDVTVVAEIDDGRAALQVTVDVVAPNGPFAVEAELVDPAGTCIEVPQSDASVELKRIEGRLSADLTLDVDDALLWTPEAPHLYTLSLSLRDAASGAKVDAWSGRTGFRTVEVEGARLLLNGEPLTIKGLCRYEDYPDHARCHDDASLAQDLDLVKWLGGNALRHHFPPGRRHFELCDERGILNVVEVPLYQWGRPLAETDHPDALGAAKAQLRETIGVLKNNPSVLMWSVSNENLVKARGDADSATVELARTTADGNIELVALANELDPTRPAIEVSNCWPGDPVFEATDVLAPNIYIGLHPMEAANVGAWTAAMHERMDELRGEFPDKPILAAEYGSWSIRGLKTSYFPGEGFQAAFAKSAWEGLIAEENVIGAFIWCFADSDVHRRFKWIYEYRCAYGLFDFHRRPKESAYAMREAWSK